MDRARVQQRALDTCQTCFSEDTVRDSSQEFCICGEGLRLVVMPTLGTGY